MNYENPINLLNEPIDEQRKKSMYDYEPYALTFISESNCCDFCLHPTGPVFPHYTDMDNICGFISCKSCIETGRIAVLNWKSTRTYGRVEHLRNRRIKIYRSRVVKQKKSDTIGVPPDTLNFLHIQDGWMIDSHIDIINNIEYISCKMLLSHLIKKCRVDDLILLNGKE